MRYKFSSLMVNLTRALLLINCVLFCACSIGRGNSLQGIYAIAPEGGKIKPIVQPDLKSVSDSSALPPPAVVSMHPGTSRECVLLMHGLSRSAASMRKMQKILGQSGYLVFALDYPSTQYSIEELSLSILPAGIAACRSRGVSRIHLVTHSMGGIIARHYLKHHTVPEFGRLVMLAPPNQGSELVNFYRSVPGFEMLMGPAAMQLGTDKANSLPLNLGPVSVETAVITGTVSSNSLMSLTLPGVDDGKVTAVSTGVEGMCAQVSLPTSHLMIMKDDVSIGEVLNYIETGEFKASQAVYFNCNKRRKMAISLLWLEKWM